MGLSAHLMPVPSWGAPILGDLPMQLVIRASHENMILNWLCLGRGVEVGSRPPAANGQPFSMIAKVKSTLGSQLIRNVLDRQRI